jgi:hypothetical protein
VNKQAKSNSVINDQDTVELKSNLKILKQQYGDYLLFCSIDNVVFKNSKDINDKSGNYYLSYGDSIETILKEHPDTISRLLHEIQKKESSNNLIKRIEVWCESYVIMNVYLNTDQYISLEEILWDIPCTKKIIQSFLNHPAQDWGSLSESQVYELPYRVSNYISELSDTERVNFYKLFFNKMIIIMNQ